MAGARAARRLYVSSARGARGRDDPKPQDVVKVWAISPRYNGTAATSWETIISGPLRPAVSARSWPPKRGGDREHRVQGPLSRRTAFGLPAKACHGVCH